jgi:hypothetical protein
MAEAAPARAQRSAVAARRAAPQRRVRARASYPGGFRWARVALLVAAVVVGLPLAHAVLGELAALFGGAAALGFLLGRWTASPARGR